MDDRDWLARRFEAHRSRLRAVAYRMLGSSTEADDAVQETWLRLSRTDVDAVDNLAGWLTTVVARVSLNMLQARTTRREEPAGEDLPDPVSEDGDDPEQQALQAEGVGLALLVVLDTLTPPERLAFVLHDLFAVPFEEIAPILGRSPAAARQLASRARRRLQGAPAPDTDLARQRAVVDAFLAASREGTSRPWWPCSTPTWSSGPTRRRCGPARTRRSAGRRPWPATSRGGPSGPALPWSTGPPARCGRRAGGPGWCSASPSPTAGSWPSTCWPTPSGWTRCG